MSSSTADAGIVQAAVSVGRHLGLQVVAEGVEDEAALRRLVDMGCDLVQGYLVGRPMPADDLFQVARAALTAGLAHPGRGS
jgi:EAL domain-containing protein (putative c-di-GMP-specific phosphodiesterase class I)